MHIHLRRFLFEKEDGVELQLVLGAGDHSCKHVVCRTVVLSPQRVQGLVAMEIFALGSVTSSACMYVNAWYIYVCMYVCTYVCMYVCTCTHFVTACVSSFPVLTAP